MTNENIGNYLMAIQKRIDMYKVLFEKTSKEMLENPGNIDKFLDYLISFNSYEKLLEFQNTILKAKCSIE